MLKGRSRYPRQHQQETQHSFYAVQSANYNMSRCSATKDVGGGGRTTRPAAPPDPAPPGPAPPGPAPPGRPRLRLAPAGDWWWRWPALGTATSLAVTCRRRHRWLGYWPTLLFSGWDHRWRRRPGNVATSWSCLAWEATRPRTGAPSGLPSPRSGQSRRPSSSPWGAMASPG